MSWFPPRHPRAVITISGPQASNIFYEELEKELAAKAAINAKGTKRRKQDERREDRRRDPMTRDDSDEDEIEISDREKLSKLFRPKYQDSKAWNTLETVFRDVMKVSKVF